MASWPGEAESKQGGFIARVRTKKWEKKKLPDLKRASVKKLKEALFSESNTLRFFAQRELLRKNPTPEDFSSVLVDGGAAPSTRMAALLGMAAIADPVSRNLLMKGADSKDSKIRALSFRMLGDLGDVGDSGLFDAIVAERNPHALREMLIAAVRNEVKDPVVLRFILIHANSSDPVIAHLATRAVRDLDAVDGCFSLLDDPDSKSLWPGALRVLSQVHKVEVVDGIIERRQKSDSWRFQNQSLAALGRLYLREGEWSGENPGKQPDTSGPFLYSETWEGSKKIEALFHQMERTGRIDRNFLLYEMSRNGIGIGSVFDLVQKAQTNVTMEAPAISMLLQEDSTPDFALPFLSRIMKDSKRDGGLRFQAALAMFKSTDSDAFDEAAAFYQKSENVPYAARFRPQLREAMLNGAHLEAQVDALVAKTRGSDKESGMQSWEILFQLNQKDSTAHEAKEKIAEAVAAAAAHSENSYIRLLNAIAEYRFAQGEPVVRTAFESSSSSVKSAAWKAGKAIGIYSGEAPKPPPAEPVE